MSSPVVVPFKGNHAKGSSVWVTSINKQYKISSYLTPLLRSLLLNKLERFYFSILIDLSYNLLCCLHIQPLCFYHNVIEHELVFDCVMWRASLAVITLMLCIPLCWKLLFLIHQRTWIGIFYVCVCVCVYIYIYIYMCVCVCVCVWCVRLKAQWH
jgi:hypothetical protein